MNPREVFQTDKLLEFWPTARQSARERVSATTRFVIYSTCVVYLINRDPRVFALGALVLAILYYMYVSRMISDGKLRPAQGDARMPGPLRDQVTMPTMDNPMGNVLMTDYVDKPDRPAAAWYPSMRAQVQSVWSRIHPYERQRDAERNFYTVASTTIPNDQAGFAQAAYGKPFAPKCHDQGGAACDPDRFYSTFPETTQLRGGNGGGYGAGSK
ncbi:hypothetical protein [Yellowstone lake phycodnavirus 3]|jgi:hypothetical protein|uniref:hypothetical protein n=1 Tax=Yellowstone lake phycodnavirus 3 TaxID=1586715 RepID=UPI0006EB7080|nr:hypothetical protein AR677_gp004 [Yellowstone lake phycodnavirus 3]BAT22503.1 hypothetical protein [Yellowstone lake phycodnavirus 3]